MQKNENSYNLSKGQACTSGARGKWALTVIVLLAAIGFTPQAEAQSNLLKISGFSEVRFNSSFGTPADPEAAERFELSGGEEHMIEKGNNISFSGINLNLQSELNAKLHFQSELYLAYEHDELELHLLRAYADYRISEKFNLQAGKFLAPIGYLNRNQRIYSYLNYSVKPRDMVNEEMGFIPLFVIGLQAYGSLPLGNSNINYRVAYGTNRSQAPHGGSIATAHIGEEEETSPGWSGLIEYLAAAGNGDITVGLSGYSNGSIKTIYVVEGDSVASGDLQLRETGIAPYVRLDQPRFQLMAEYHAVTFEDLSGVTGANKHDYKAASVELVYKTSILNRPLYPYVRYDYRKVSSNHPFYGLLMEHDEIQKTYPFNNSEIMAGFCWDILESSRLKVEYGTFTTGPMPGNRITVSTSFAF
ncbi:MAG: hypothetical protein HC859_04260 [Bacteroidia bacterium]|nr:hypothetical protein [Bacteroidia bacterium]